MQLSTHFLLILSNNFLSSHSFPSEIMMNLIILALYFSSCFSFSLKFHLSHFIFIYNKREWWKHNEKALWDFPQRYNKTQNSKHHRWVGKTSKSANKRASNCSWEAIKVRRDEYQPSICHLSQDSLSFIINNIILTAASLLMQREKNWNI